MNQFKFSIAGEVLKPCEYCTAYRKNDMLVIEFLTNAIFPMLVTRNGDRCNLVVLGTKILEVKENLTVTIHKLDSAGNIGFVFDSELESILCTVSFGLDICAGAFRFQEPQILKWAEHHGVGRPVGCVWTVRGTRIEHGCKFIRKRDCLIVDLPNGFKFPIFCKENGVQVVHEFVECEKYGFFVRSYEYNDYQVRFRIVVFWKNNIRVFDDLIYTVKGVHYGSSYMSGGSIAKLMLLGG